MMTDPIADMLTRIRNAHLAGKRQVVIPFSKVKMAILDVMKQEGYIEEVTKEDANFGQLVVNLKYNGKQPMITQIRRASKPGHRMYRQKDELPAVLNGYGMAIISTSQGIMSGKEAKKRGIGGEIMCTIY